MKCFVCLQMEDEERTLETAVRSKLLGHAAYAICVRCALEVPDLKDPEYLAPREALHRVPRVVIQIHP